MTLFTANCNSHELQFAIVDVTTEFEHDIAYVFDSFVNTFICTIKTAENYTSLGTKQTNLSQESAFEMEVSKNLIKSSSREHELKVAR